MPELKTVRVTFRVRNLTNVVYAQWSDPTFRTRFFSARRGPMRSPLQPSGEILRPTMRSHSGLLRLRRYIANGDEPETATMFPPERIVCLTEETVETLYLLGEQDRIVGISGYTVRPPRARREKPRVSAFTSADIPKIVALKPDLVLTFSDLQADIVADADPARHRTSMPSISAASPKSST